jgi:hypothetical protein
MGYTHYWYKIRNLNTIKFENLLDDFSKLLDQSDEVNNIAEGDFHGEFYQDTQIQYNGIGDNQHETFFLERDTPKLEFEQWYEHGKNGKTHLFNFCKTARKPYDLLVCANLIIAKKKLGKEIIISSDGSNEEWQEAKDLCQKHLGYGALFDIERGTFRRIEVTA